MTMNRKQFVVICTYLLAKVLLFTVTSAAQTGYDGRYFSGSGDTSYIELLDKAYRMMRPDAELENLSMLYKPEWNGFVEGPTWDMWWIQNSFGPTYTMLPFMDKVYQTFVLNSQNLWFDKIGDGKRKDRNGYVAPIGSLCDCASPGKVYFRQGDAQHRIHDWGYGFTAAGIILQSELLLIKRDMEAIHKYLPLLEQAAEFIDARRDPVKNIFLVGPAGNLLAPSYAGTGVKKDDGSYGKAYLAEISVNYIAGLDRLIELEKMAGRTDKVKLYKERRGKVKNGLKYFTTDEGYFIRSIDIDGTRHGVYGAPRHGYFETVPNHDAMAFRVADDKQAYKIYEKIASIPQLRPNKLILPNYPGYDDMYQFNGLFVYGKWINGGHWTTCEARMQIGYYRVGAFKDAGEAFKKILRLAPMFRLDNNLTDFGAGLYQPNQPVNCVYDAWGAPGGFMRGLFEYIYKADGLEIHPHIPPDITRLEQKFPVYFGEKQIFIVTSGSGPVTSVLINGKKVKKFLPDCISIHLDEEPDTVYVSLGLGGMKAQADFTIKPIQKFNIPCDDKFWRPYILRDSGEILEGEEEIFSAIKGLAVFHSRITQSGFSRTYECKLAELILESLQAVYERNGLKRSGTLLLLKPESQVAADNLYISTIKNLFFEFIRRMGKNRTSGSENEKLIANIWYGERLN